MDEQFQPLTTENKSNSSEEAEGKKVITGIIVATVILGGVVYAGYRYSQKKSQQQVFPSGYPVQEEGASTAEITCGETQPNPANMWDYYLKCDMFTTGTNETWVDYEDSVYGYQVSLPKSLEIAEFSNGLGIVHGIIPPAANLIIMPDFSSSRSGEFSSMVGKNYVNNYWRQFSGLSGVKNVQEFTNRYGYNGFRANFINVAGKSFSTAVFYENPSREGDFIHLSSSILHPTVFDEIVDSFQFTETAPPVETTPPAETTPTPKATPTTATTPTPSPTPTPTTSPEE